jgi:hypothetical protein
MSAAASKKEGRQILLEGTHSSLIYAKLCFKTYKTFQFVDIFFAVKLNISNFARSNLI